MRRYGLVIWLDREGHFTSLVDRQVGARLEGEARLGAPLRALRGSYLSLLRSLDGLEDGTDPSPLLIHLPGHNEQSLRATPLLELYHAGKRWRKALDTAVTCHRAAYKILLRAGKRILSGAGKRIRLGAGKRILSGAGKRTLSRARQTDPR